MRIAVDIVHPADVHFFKHAIRVLLSRGDAVLITARDKDVTLPLLDALGLPYRTLSRQPSRRLGLFVELIRRDWGLWRLCREFRPDVLTGLPGMCAAQVGWWLGRPSVVWEDTEIQTHIHRITYPFATEVHSPSCYRIRLGPKQVFYPGYKELAYLHPAWFTPDPEVLRRAGIDPSERLAVVRFVSWRAMHDAKGRGFSPDGKRALIERLAEHGRVLITSEAPLPDAWERYRVTLPAEQIHHLLAFASVVVGESATMASESVVLGTPAVYVDPFGRGYTDEQEQKYGMCFNFTPDRERQAIDTAVEILRSRELRGLIGAQRERLLSEKVDVVRYQLETYGRVAAAHARRPNAP
jgi:predicted glycosyltransferase